MNAKDFYFGESERSGKELVKDLKTLFSNSKAKYIKSDNTLKRKVIRIVLKIMLHFGYTINTKVSNVRKTGHNKWNLFHFHDYKGITKMLKFLNEAGMAKLSCYVFLMLCREVRDNPIYKNRVKDTGIFQKWIATQKYIPETIDDCPSFRGLDYTGNSCYQDSTLLALFAVPNNFITENILQKDLKPISKSEQKLISCGRNPKKDFKYRKNIQDILIDITESMRGKKETRYCSGLRQAIQNCPGAERFHGTGTQDAGEFLLYLFSIFQVEGVEKVRETSVTNYLEPIPKRIKQIREVKEKSSPLISIQDPGGKNLKLSEYLYSIEDAVFDSDNLYRHEKSGKLYKRRIESSKVVKAPYIVFNVQRLYIDNRGIERRNHTPVICPEEIHVGDNTLKLHAIIIHVSVHYTCYIRCNKFWYWYDDNPSSRHHYIKLVGSYDDMLNSEPNPRRLGTLYFYS